MKIAIISSGAWGTALALGLLQKGHQVYLLSHSEEKARAMMLSRENPMLPGVTLPAELSCTADMAVLRDCQMAVFACPSIHLREMARRAAVFLREDAVAVTVTKGIENGTFLRMSQIVQQETGRPAVVLTGPSHAEEVAAGLPTGCLAACEDRALAELVQDTFMSETFRIYTSPDAVGAELGGALKNVIALCAGTADGLGYGDNTLAMLMTRGITEIARLGVAMGASKDTFAGLAGIGDLIVTCTSKHSRNRRAGVYIGQGCTPREALSKVGAVVEGYYAAASARELARKAGVETPIVEAAYQVLYENMDPEQAVKALLLRGKRPESEDAGWL